LERDKYARDLELLHELSLELTCLLDEKKILAQLINIFVRVDNITRASVMLFDETENLLHIKTGINVSDHAVKTVKLKPGEGIAGRVFLSGEPVLVKNTGTDTLYHGFFDGTKVTIPDEQMLCLPIRFKSKSWGVVNLHARASGVPFNEYDKKIFSIVTNQAAVALTNAYFYRMAISDSLTGLYVHQYFKQKLAHEMEIAQKYRLPISLLLFDIDHFKKFNDTYGHQTGDYILKQLAEFVQQTVPATGICARYGGEEFVIILPETNVSEAVTIADELRSKIESLRLAHSNNEFRITVSVGVSGHDYKTRKTVTKLPETLVKQADTALYSAKESGRNCVQQFKD
jgi:diguanylate cyclase (GGDEF)-like protein